jgi:hypothetical protein
MSTMIQLMQQVMGEMGLNVPTTVAGSTNVDLIQSLALMNAVGYEIIREKEWQSINKEYRFYTVFYTYTGDLTSGSTSVLNLSSTVGLPSDSTFMVTGTGINQDTYLTNVTGTTGTLSQKSSASGTGVSLVFAQTKYALPSDWNRQVNRTHFDKSKRWEMLGPESAQQWQWLKSSYIATGPRIRYRIMGNYFQIWPILGTNEYLGFEYISNNWVTSASSTTGPDKGSFTADTDTCIFGDRLMVLGTKLKYFSIKGFDTTDLRHDYEKQLSMAMAADSGAATISFSPRPSTVLVGYENIPDSNYGS